MKPTPRYDWTPDKPRYGSARLTEWRDALLTEHNAILERYAEDAPLTAEHDIRVREIQEDLSRIGEDLVRALRGEERTRERRAGSPTVTAEALRALGIGELGELGLVRPARPTLGELITRSAWYEAVKANVGESGDGYRRGEPAIEIRALIDGSGICGDAAMPGMVPPPPPAPAPLTGRSLHVFQLAPTRPADPGASHPFFRAAAFTGLPAYTAPGATKPTVAVNGAFIDGKYLKIAAVTDPQADEVFADSAQFGAWLSAELTMAIYQALDNAMVVYADTTAPQWMGFLQAATLHPVAGALTDPWAGINAGAVLVEASSGYPADSLVMNGATFNKISTVRATAGGQYLLPPPTTFGAPLSFGGLRVALNPGVANDSIIVGAFLGASHWCAKQAVTIDRIHVDDDELKNLSRLRGEIRACLAITKTAGFALVTLT
jgi:hypothetical protein